jgi:hypothetical protein
MKKFILIALLALPSLLMAQRTEVGVFGGTSFYLGDLNPKGVFKFSQPAFGVFARYNMNWHWAVRGSVNIGWLKADDALSEDPAQISRNLSFKSVVADFSATLELNFLRYRPGDPKTPFTPYVFAGICLFKFNPKGTISDSTYIYSDGVSRLVQGGTYALQPLGTEGQNTPDNQLKKYALTQVGIPFGVGVKFNISERLILGVEWSMRKTFTDYLDDVSGNYADPVKLAAQYGAVSAAFSDRSIPNPDQPINDNIGRQRGNSKTKDWYSFAGLTISYNIKSRPDKCAAYKHTKTKEAY